MRNKKIPKNREEVEKLLEHEGFENPRLEASILWDHIYNEASTQDIKAHLHGHISKLYLGVPIQRQVGYTIVRGKRIKITPDVLLPGPEIDLILDSFFDYAKTPELVVDMCTGCGVISSIIGEEFPKSRVYATDISKKALEVAKSNICSRNVILLEGDLFDPLKREGVSKVNVLISNPPYCRTGDIAQLPRQIKDHTPKIAIDGGSDGYSVHRRIIQEAASYLGPRGLLILENEVGQTRKLGKMFRREGYALESTRKNSRGEERVIIARRIK